MGSRNISLADGIVTFLNSAQGGSFVASFTAVATLLLFVDLETARSLQVLVSPVSDLSQAFTRGDRLHDLITTIFVVKPLEPDTDPKLWSKSAEIKTLIELAEQIADYFPVGATLTSDGMKCVEVRHEPIFDPVEMLKNRRFMSAIQLTFKTT